VIATEIATYFMATYFKAPAEFVDVKSKGSGHYRLRRVVSSIVFPP
jgi:hypothetical protein